ncbi:hypothetical protein NTE_03009 [Candidatus Nitrososphaera evergladensis SR1]|uniref:Uncharacterized protein n=1 Tax=Candidatus Nitrososphaera evergladensis SR1 TaxID=1459636 RepID=A0A075N0P4_9ARCH|nr:hypothetical protein NTE_03009 [Candidatus Nitrososphaera evergladensis SR1]
MASRALRSLAPVYWVFHRMPKLQQSYYSNRQSNFHFLPSSFSWILSSSKASIISAIFIPLSPLLVFKMLVTLSIILGFVMLCYPRIRLLAYPIYRFWLQYILVFDYWLTVRQKGQGRKKSLVKLNIRLLHNNRHICLQRPEANAFTG